MPQRELPSLAGAAWLQDEPLAALLKALNSEGETRVVGGAVRNALLGVPIADVDLATVLLPQQVMAIGKAHGFGVHPTGIDHGTVMLSVGGSAFEVTTLREDVSTNGRHAVVAFTRDWARDAARRDFTMNSLYCDSSGKIYDFTGGYKDICKRKVKFVGNAEQRIREDYLRILRFFRFHASYGAGAPDAAALKACMRCKSGLATLSAERIRQELMKLLVAPAAVKTLKQMAEAKILKLILPHTDEWRVLARCPEDAILRLAILAKSPSSLQETLKLSRSEAGRLERVSAAPALSPKLSDAEQRRMLYQLGVNTWRDAVNLSFARGRAKRGDPKWQDLLNLVDRWSVPELPVNGSDLLQQGIAPGPDMGQVLQGLEDWWVASDFRPTKQELLARSGRYLR